MLNASLTGFGAGFSPILAIGAQNSFVLRQGLLRAHVFWVCLIRAVSTGFPGWSGKLAYGPGAALASFVFYFGHGYGAHLIEPVFARPRAWAVLDVAIAVVMWSIAATLIFGQISAV